MQQGSLLAGLPVTNEMKMRDFEEEQAANNEKYLKVPTYIHYVTLPTGQPIIHTHAYCI